MRFGRQDEIHATGGHGGLRHGGELCRSRVLRKRHAARGFDSFHTRRAVRPRTGEYHADGRTSALIGQLIAGSGR